MHENAIDDNDRAIKSLYIRAYVCCRVYDIYSLIERKAVYIQWAQYTATVLQIFPYGHPQDQSEGSQFNCDCICGVIGPSESTVFLSTST